MFSEITEDSLQEIVQTNAMVFVQFSAGWCGNCRIMKPKFKHQATQHEDAVFVVVDAEKFPESRKMAKVDNLPTFAAFVNGTLINQIQTNKAENLNTFIDEVTNH